MFGENVALVQIRTKRRLSVKHLIACFFGATYSLCGFAAADLLVCGEKYVAFENSLSIKVSESRSTQLQSYINCLADAVVGGEETPRLIRLELPAGKTRLLEPLTVPRGLLEKGVALQVQSGAGGRAVLSGAMSLSGWRLMDEQRRVALGVPLSEGLYRVEVPNQVANAMRKGLNRDHGQKLDMAPPELIVDGKIFGLAQWPLTGFMKAKEGHDNVVSIRHSDMPPAADGDALMAHGFWFHDWADSQRTVASVDRASATVKLDGPPVRYGIKPGARFVLQNSPSFVRKHGDYAVAREKNEVYFFSNQPPSEVEVTGSASIIKGASSRVRLVGVTLEGVRGNAVDLIGDGNEITDVTVRNVGLVGIRINGYRNIVKNSHVHNVGAIGVELLGGDRKTLRSSDSVLVDSTIEHVGRLIWSANPGVRVVGVGVKVSGNVVRYGPHAGIFYFGNDHLIENNEVYEVAKLTDDVGGIYTGQDWTARGSRVVGNYVHDLHGVGREGATAYYLDDQASGVLVEENVAWNVDRGALVGGGRNNKILRNIFVHTSECLKIDERGLTTQGPNTRIGKRLLERLHAVDFSDSPYLERYPNLGSVLLDRPGVPVGNVVKFNFGLCGWKVANSARESGDVSINQQYPGGVKAVLATAPFDAPERRHVRRQLTPVFDFLGSAVFEK